MIESYIASIRIAKTVQELSAAIKSIDGRPIKSEVVVTPQDYANARRVRRFAYLTASKIYTELRTQNPSLDIPKFPPVGSFLKDILAWCEAVEKAAPKAGAR